MTNKDLKNNPKYDSTKIHNQYDRVAFLMNEDKMIEGIVVGIEVESSSVKYHVQVGNKTVVKLDTELKSLEDPVKFKHISLPILTGLDTVTLESAILKVFEEGGELSRVIGKQRGLNGEARTITEEQALDRIGEELLDLIQTTVTMSKLLEDRYNIKIDDFIDEHIRKVIKKGYLI